MVESDVRVTWAQALGWRARRQLLDPVGTGSVTDVLRRLGSVPASDGALAELTVRTRSSEVGAGDLAAAVADGSVVTAFAFGGGVHHLAGQQGADLLALRAAGRQWELPSWVEHYGLAADDWPGFRAAVRDALADGPLTVPELGGAVTALPAYRHLRPVFAEGAVTLLKPLTWQGDVSLAPPREGRLVLRRLEVDASWPGPADLEEAGPRAIVDYLRSYGPATPDHVHHRFGEGLSAGRRRLQRWLGDLGDTLATVDVEGTTALVARDDVDDLLAATASPAVRLLPGHDPWVMGPGTKDVHVVPPPCRPAVTRKAHPVLVAGVVRGTWRRSGDDLEVTWLDQGPPPNGELHEEVARLGGLLERDLRLEVVR